MGGGGGGGVPQLNESPGLPRYPGRAKFSYVSLENALKRLHGTVDRVTRFPEAPF